MSITRDKAAKLREILDEVWGILGTVEGAHDAPPHYRRPCDSEESRQMLAKANNVLAKARSILAKPPPADFAGDGLEQIRAKCEQYWNENVRLNPEEMRAILEFIHVRAADAEAKAMSDYPAFVVESGGIRCGADRGVMDLDTVRGLLTEQRRTNIEMHAKLKRVRETPIGRGLLPPDGISLGELCDLRDRVAELEKNAEREMDAEANLKRISDIVKRARGRCDYFSDGARTLHDLQDELVKLGIER